MKIGIVTPAFYPYPGGVTEHVYHTYLELGRLGHDVKIITTSFGPGGSPCEHDVIRIGRAFSVPANGSICPVAVDLRMSNQFRTVFRDESFDVVHLHEPLMPALCLAALSQVDMPAVGTFHASNDRSLGYKLFRPLLDRYVQKLTRRIAVSNAARDTAIRHFDGEYEIVPNGVDVGRFSSAEPIEELRDGSLNILFVGRMEPRKGAKHLLRAMPRICEEIPGCRLVVVGGGPLASHYGKYVPESCSGRIMFTGHVSNEMLARHYATADVFCSPATGGESFGIVLLEAMASSSAIVASNITGYNDVVDDGRTGILVAPASPEAIASAVIRVAREPELKARIVGAARAEVERYAWDRVTKDILRVYEDAIGGTSGDHPAGGGRVNRKERIGEKETVAI